jgi:hypothetical protein
VYRNQGRDKQYEEGDPRARCAHLEPFRKIQGRDQIDRNYRRQHEADDVVVTHSFSTSFCR